MSDLIPKQLSNTWEADSTTIAELNLAVYFHKKRLAGEDLQSDRFYVYQDGSEISIERIDIVSDIGATKPEVDFETYAYNGVLHSDDFGNSETFIYEVECGHYHEILNYDEVASTLRIHQELESM